ncbi:hypothetical protein JTE90_024591 [Oedothorax gibbosus]|uniref:Synaptonemal complex protein 2 Spt16M-like domain-containing protein n=1 Tax=Oedothorax gibbosus TaxID=931172 RepID=A0AAV6VE55_9ARAC|nr:hypothetical protein JTE90_024591 [Oedothorax gibbosus]
MEVDTDKLETLLETAIGHGSLEELMEFLCASGDEEYLNFVINEMRNNIKEILSTSPDSQFKITNILNIILGLAEIALFGPEKSEYLTRCLLNIAVNECCSIFNLKHVLTMLKTFFSDDHILAWGSSDESLFVPIKQLGVKLTDIGDYECQSILLETLWQISEADRNFWAQMWFSQEKSALMFLNLNPEKFVLECRQFLNFHNRNGGNQRTFAFVATSVSLGSVQLRKPYGAEFWVDFNHDTQSISFFCSSLHQENEQTWETVFISSEIVEGYCIQNQKSKTTKELLITLNCSCSQLLSLEDTSIAGLESQLIQMTFWSFLDIQCHAEALFKRNIPYPVEENVNSKAFKQARRASEPKEIVCSQDYQEQIAASQNSKRRRASEPIELLCTSNFPELHSTVSSLKRNKHKKASESTELVCPPDPQEMISKQHIRKRRRVSESLQLIPTVDRQGDTACETYADEVNAPDHTEHLPCEGSPEKQKRSSNNLVNLLGDNQNLHSDSKYTQDSVARNGQSAKKRSQNSELLAVSSVFPRKSSQVSIEKNVLTTKKSSRNAELLEVSSMSQRNLSQITSNGNVQSIPKRSQNAQLLEVFCDSPKKMSPDCVERHLQSTPNRSLNHGHRNSPQSVSDLEGTCAISPTPLNKKTKPIPKLLTSETQKPTNSLLKDNEYVAENRTVKKVSRMTARMSLGRNATESKNKANISLNSSSSKKKLLYNIHKAPIYDVPPSTKKCINDMNANISHTSQTFLSPNEHLAINEPAKKENKHCSSVKDIPQILNSKVAVSKSNSNSNLIYETERGPISPILAAAENCIQEIDTLRHVLNNNLPTEDKELSDFEMEVEMTDHQSKINKLHDTNMTVKKHRITRSKKNQENNSRHENSTELFDDEEPQIVTIHSPERKSRKAAVNARKRNKVILEQKGSETSFEGTQKINQQNITDGLSQETVEYDVHEALLPSKGKVLTSYKRKTLDRDKSEDMLETNAPKSLKKPKTVKKTDKNWESFDEDEYVFRTPPPLVKRKKRKRSVFFTDTETGSSEVSWLNKINLFETPKKSYSNRKKTIESKKKKPVKQKPRRSKKPIITPSNKVQRNKASDSESRSRSAFSEFNLVIEKEKIPLPSAELSGLFRSLKRNSRHSSITEDNFQSRNQEVELDGCYENENSVQLCYGDNISCISENSALNWGFNKSTNAKQQKVRPSTSGRSTIEPEVLSKDKKSIKNSNVSHKSKNSKDVNTSKQRLANLLMSKPIIEKSRNVEHSTSNDYTIVEDPTKKQKTNAGQGSEGFIRNSVADTVSNDPQNVQIALETVVKVSPFKRNKAVTSKRWISPNKIVEVSEEQSILEDMNTLTEKSLNERNDDTDKNKKRHLYSYLDSLSSVSPNPETAEKIGIAEDFLTLENTKSNPLIEKTSKEGLLQHSIPEEKIAKSSLKRPKQHAIKKHQTDYAKEFKPSDRSLQSSSAMFQKDHSNEKISCEYNLVTKTSVLHILSDEVNNLTFRLFCTLKKCMSDFRQKMVALRESIVKTADSMLANESKFSERDLQSLASDCRKSRLHIQKNLRKLYAMGNEYFESEKRLEKRLAKKNKKAVVKYTKSLQIAQSIAEKALEERFLLKSKAFLKSFLKKMELV